MSFQTTVASAAHFSGIGLHSGEQVNLSVLPAPADHGIRFHVSRPGGAAPVVIPATPEKVAATAYATSLREGPVALHTVEHLLSALAGLGIDNAQIHVDAEEVPIMDGSALPFIHGLLKAGIRPLAAPRMVIRILEPIRVEEDGGGKWLEVTPLAAPETVIDYHIEFAHEAVGTQRYRFVLSPDTFVGELAAARTFGFAREVEALRQAGLARGGSLDNAVVIGDDGVLNPEGLRFVDEQVRHKILDLIGDLALVGRPVLGRISAHRSGHGLHTRLAQAILARPEAWELVEQPAPLVLDHAGVV